jgi:hypothetical protein
MKRARDASRAPRKDTVHGEGNYEAARQFNKAEHDFVASGKVAAAARNMAPKSDREARELLDAERESRARAKEEDPALTRAFDAPASRDGGGRPARRRSRARSG